MILPPWRMIDAGVQLVVRVTTRGARDAIEGTDEMSDGRAVLKVRIRAAPEHGEANVALIRLLATTFKMRRSDIEISAGSSSRIKQLVLRGDAKSLMAMLTRGLTTQEAGS